MPKRIRFAIGENMAEYARYFNLEQVGKDVTSLIKSASWFPYKTGKLKYEATKGEILNATTFRISFNSSVAPYIDFLENGTRPHDIPNAFGKSLPFGIGGRFDGRFHPGSTKHKGFIADKSVNAIINYIVNLFGGTVEQL